MAPACRGETRQHIELCCLPEKIGGVMDASLTGQRRMSIDQWDVVE